LGWSSGIPWCAATPASATGRAAAAADQPSCSAIPRNRAARPGRFCALPTETGSGRRGMCAMGASSQRMWCRVRGGPGAGRGAGQGGHCDECGGRPSRGRRGRRLRRRRWHGRRRRLRILRGWPGLVVGVPSPAAGRGQGAGGPWRRRRGVRAVPCGADGALGQGGLLRTQQHEWGRRGA